MSALQDAMNLAADKSRLKDVEDQYAMDEAEALKTTGFKPDHLTFSDDVDQGVVPAGGHTGYVRDPDERHGIVVDDGKTRQFDTGASRNTAEGKIDMEGFLSPLVVEAYGEYMNFNRVTPTGVRASDNWQKGIPKEVYIKSGFRHWLEVWRHHRGLDTRDGIVWAVCGLMFNVMGYLHTLLEANPLLLGVALDAAQRARSDTDDWDRPPPREAFSPWTGGTSRETTPPRPRAHG